MLSLYSTTPSFQPQVPYSAARFTKLESLEEAVESFTNLTLTTGTTVVRLHCSVPTWSSPTDTCLDLHDLNELRSRFLVFVHDLTQALRHSGIMASYSLAPSASSLCFVTATLSSNRAGSKLSKPIDLHSLQADPGLAGLLTRDAVVLVDTDKGPCLIIA